MYSDLCSTLTRRDGGLDDSNLQIGSSFGKDIGGTETTASSTNDDDVALCILIKILEVPRCHSSHDLTFADGIKLETIPFVDELVQQLHVTPNISISTIDSDLPIDAISGMLQGVNGGLRVCGCRWNHRER